ncbi:Uu.00g084350.m01.CDS01 [Anthostomella pinea]|uniref:Uu.00g084350.m01.CDS01 n=1 Tax=Anthostomella pinea TaxID=933095 RepID=A0AAI8VLS0_9PEZI|nr:Uu.00g084350.m01.CDS01 [Anthostomella pinea]
MASKNLPGEQLAASAYNEPKIKPDALGAALIGVNLALVAICVTIIGLRIWIKFWMFRSCKVWGADHLLAILGFVGVSNPGNSYSG